MPLIVLRSGQNNRNVYNNDNNCSFNLYSAFHGTQNCFTEQFSWIGREKYFSSVLCIFMKEAYFGYEESEKKWKLFSFSFLSRSL